MSRRTALRGVIGAALGFPAAAKSKQGRKPGAEGPRGEGSLFLDVTSGTLTFTMTD